MIIDQYQKLKHEGSIEMLYLCGDSRQDIYADIILDCHPETCFLHFHFYKKDRDTVGS